MNKTIIISFLILGYITDLTAQEQYTSDAYLLEYEIEDDTFYLNQAYFLNAFNKGAYNAELSFINADQLLMISNRNPQQARTAEVVFLDIIDQTKSILTQNRRQESSPMAIKPEGYSAIQTSLESGNVLNVFDFELRDESKALFPKLDNVSSSCWLDDDTVILQLNSDIDYMAVAYRSDESFKILEANVGPRFVKSTDVSFYYVHKLNANQWMLKHYDLEYLKKKTIIKMPQDTGVFARLNDGSFICAKGSTILRYNPGDSNEWQLLFDLSYLGINNIVDLQSMNNRITVVNKK